MPAARKPELAGERFLQAFRSVTRCVTRDYLGTTARSFAADETNTISFLDPASLRAPQGGPSGLFLDIQHQFAIIAHAYDTQRTSWRVSTRMYEYRLLDRTFKELLVYHWQPGSDFRGPNQPHLHVSASLYVETSSVESTMRSTREYMLDKFHIPTGRVSLAAVVQLLIEDFGVAPQQPNWKARLEETDLIFQAENEQRP